MNELALALASLIIGVVATIWVSRYYFKRATDKSLTPYVQFISSLFEGVDSSVRDSLKAAYKGMAITDLLGTKWGTKWVRAPYPWANSELTENQGQSALLKSTLTRAAESYR